MSLSVRLHREPNITQMISRVAFLDRQFQALFSDPHQTQTIFTDAADGYRSRGVSHEPIERRPYINRKDVAFFQLIFGGKSMNHLFVDRSANRKRKPVVALEGR